LVWPKNEELAILTVNGMQYRDWESVSVRHALKEYPYIHSRFTCSEGMPSHDDRAAIAFVSRQAAARRGAAIGVASPMSVFGGKADVVWSPANVAL